MRSFFTFNGESSLDYGLYVEEIPNYNVPAKRINTFTVPGRSGDYVMDDETFDNVDQSYRIWFKSPDEMNSFQATRRVCNWLLSANGYQRLEDSYDPDTYRQAMFLGSAEFSSWFMKYGRAVITFSCMPQRYFKNSPEKISVDNGMKIYNTWMPAKPLLYVKGSGAAVTGKINIGSYLINFPSTITNEIIIDCDSQIAIYNGEEVYDDLLSFPNGSPTLIHGETVVTYNDGISSLSISPRWWCI